MYISGLYEKELHYACQRFSNNSTAEFTAAELMTVFENAIFFVRDCEKSVIFATVN